ncbi:U4/U6 small nuclear ribonucleoprotein PRP4-like, partial [Trifolium medium]|nr:U4/U6 small nuclear ribonucleoprotein PRP4-like [Trifolium medium]
PFRTEGSKSLLNARIDIAKCSLVRAAMRLQRSQRRRDDLDEDVDAKIDCTLKQAANLNLELSEIGDDQLLTGSLLVFPGWKKDCYLFSKWSFQAVEYA